MIRIRNTTHNNKKKEKENLYNKSVAAAAG